MLNLKKLEEEQVRLARKVISKDSFENIKLVGGVDCAYFGNKVIAAIAICDYPGLVLQEKVYCVLNSNIPYIEGFLIYREGSAISEAYSKLQNKPNILMFDGNGILHPRKCGLASHMGVLLDQASIGVAKSLKYGEIKDNLIILDGEIRGEVVSTRVHAKPIYVSLGHKISLKRSVEIVKKSVKDPHKLPEPLHLAHRIATDIAQKISKEDN